MGRSIIIVKAFEDVGKTQIEGRLVDEKGCRAGIRSALAYLDMAVDLNPFYPGWYHVPYFLHHIARGEYERAYARAQRVNMPDFF